MLYRCRCSATVELLEAGYPNGNSALYGYGERRGHATPQCYWCLDGPSKCWGLLAACIARELHNVATALRQRQPPNAGLLLARGRLGPVRQYAYRSTLPPKKGPEKISQLSVLKHV